MDSNNLNNTNQSEVRNDNPTETPKAEPSNYYQNNNQQPVTNEYAAGQSNKASGMAIASMVCGILSIVLCCVWYFSVILGIVAIVLGIVNQTKKNGGKGMAIAGIITGAVGIVLSILVIVLIILGAIGSNGFTQF